VLLVCLARPVLSNDCSFYQDVTARGWGGDCTCPDGSVYGVAAIGECDALACSDGTSGTCSKSAGPWSEKQAHCGTEPAPPPEPEPARCESEATVAYAFIAPSSLPLWGVWHRYFETCPGGSAIPMVHSQELDEDRRAELSAQVGEFGGQLLPLSETRQGDPRYSFLFVSIQFALYRAAAKSRAANGCSPQWVHLLSETDAPASACGAVHEQLGSTPNVSHLHLDAVVDKGIRTKLHHGPLGPNQLASADIAPAAYTSPWSTLAMAHAAELAADECGLVAKWRPYMVFDDATHGEWEGITTWPGHVRNYGGPAEWIFYTELSQRGVPFETFGLTLSSFEFGDQPATFETSEEVLKMCYWTAQEGYFFFRKVVVGVGSLDGILDALSACVPELGIRPADYPNWYHAGYAQNYLAAEELKDAPPGPISHFLAAPTERLLFCWIEKVACQAFNDLMCSINKGPNASHERTTELTATGTKCKGAEGSCGDSWEVDCNWGTMGYASAQSVGMSRSDVRDALRNDEWTSAVFLRDPLDRFLSAWLSKCVAGHDDDGPRLCAIVFGEPRASFDAAVRVMNASVYKPWPEGHAEDHWRRQSEFCDGSLFADPYGLYEFVEVLDKGTSHEAVGRMLSLAGIDPDSQPAYNAHFPATANHAAAESHEHATNAEAKRAKYWSPEQVRSILRYYQKDYLTFRLPAPAWTVDMVGCAFLRELRLSAQGC